jgi:hypothetical protein
MGKHCDNCEALYRQATHAVMLAAFGWLLCLSALVSLLGWLPGVLLAIGATIMVAGAWGFHIKAMQALACEDPACESSKAPEHG